mmetsp:Transcript_35490/g.58133  ORF Transcript_35490/g.58133 Transcript_35490/m.58133 type:complete len:87 (-) Transcript_35490:206-466(-)
MMRCESTPRFIVSMKRSHRFDSMRRRRCKSCTRIVTMSIVVIVVVVTVTVTVTGVSVIVCVVLVVVLIVIASAGAGRVHGVAGVEL